MKLTKEEALRLHRKMWTDMFCSLGNYPIFHERVDFKDYWIKNHFPTKNIIHDCFLCEYANTSYDKCENLCPIKWPGGRCEDGTKTWQNMPLLEILALPERKD